MLTRFPASAGLLIALTLAACGDAAPDPRTLPPLVRVMRPLAGSDAAPGFTGVVAARVQSDLGFRVGGKVTERLVNAGQAVRRGQPLMRIDRTDLALATRASLETVTAAQARSRQTAADERRLRDLVAAGAISAAAYDQARAAAETARAQLDAARAQARVAANESSYGVLVADADGTVVETLAEPGQVVTPGQIVVRIAHAGPREALVQLPETVRPPIGSTAQARTYAGAAGPARLRQLSGAANPDTRTFEARYVLSGAPAAAPLGSTVTIALTNRGGSAAAIRRVSLGAIHDAGRGPGVWVVRGGNPATVAFRPVRIVALDGESATVGAGLNPGDRVVAMGAHLLHQDQTVRVAAGASNDR